MKKLLILAFLTIVLIVRLQKIYALNQVPETTFDKEASYISHSIEYQKVDKKFYLKNFLEKRKSPLVDHIDTFIKVSEEYDIDYRLLPAISCVESGCGKVLIPGSHNAWGWGGGYIKFNDYEEAITKIAAGMDKGYFKKGRITPQQIGPIYAPPSKTWAGKVEYFMEQIQEI